MIRRNGEYTTELRPHMRDGEGTVKMEHFWDSERELRGLNRMVARLTLPPGTSIGFHRHEREIEIFVVVRGTGEVNDDGVTATVHAGDTILTGFGAGHGIRAVGEDPLELVAIITRQPEA